MDWLTRTVTVRFSAGWSKHAAGWLVVFLLWWGMEQAALAARFIDYLYIEANEGDSSGGHAAIRFDNQTFHFQHENPGILRVRRVDSAAFDHVYTKLGNRTIQESRIAVSDETYTLLEEAFDHLRVIQDSQLDIRAALHRDVELFELLLRRHDREDCPAETASMPLKGLGYFLPDGPEPLAITAVASDNGHGAGHSPALRALRDRIQATYGERFLEERLVQIGTMLREMELRVAEPPVTGISPDIYPAFSPPVSTRFDDALLAYFAFGVLQTGPQLRPGTFWTSDADTFRLSPQEAQVMKAYAASLENDLVRLVNSSRSDWGFPFVVGMARLAAIEASLVSGQLVFLDVFTGENLHIPLDAVTEHRYLPAMKNELHEVFYRRRGEFFTNGDRSEADYASLERAGNLLLELDRACSTGSPVRSPPETPYPSRLARRSDLVLPHIGAASIAQKLAAARAADRDYSMALSRLYSYDLFHRNCVTEIFAVLNRTLERLGEANEHADRLATTDPVEVIRAESVRRLGGFVDPSRGFIFIPFVSAREVEARYAVTARRERPSYRSERLAEMRERESPFILYLRESNTLTSTIYRPGPGDSAFLFFTDDTLLLRPLYGAFNLVTGLGESLLGLVTMPGEGPERLLSGVKGVLFSLPELAFVNLRKGSMAYVEQSTESSSGNPSSSPHWLPSADKSRHGEEHLIGNWIEFKK